MIARTLSEVFAMAELDSRKGDYRVYNEYKQKIELMCSSSVEYQDSCRRIAELLKVYEE